MLIGKLRSLANLHPNHDFTANKRLDVKVSIFANICMFIATVHLPIFIQIVDVVDFHFKSQRFESSTLGSSDVIILQTVTDRANIAIANI